MRTLLPLCALTLTLCLTASGGAAEVPMGVYRGPSATAAAEAFAAWAGRSGVWGEDPIG